MFGSDVVRPAGVAARSSAAWASSAAAAAASGVPAISRIRSATSRRSSIGVEVPPVTPTILAPANGAGSVRSWTLSIWIAVVPAISHSRVSSLVFALERPPTTTIRSTSPAVSRVSCWRRIVTGQTVLTILSSWARDDHEGGELLELPGRLGRLADERHPLLARDRGLPLLLVVDDDRVRREPEHPDDLGVLRRAEQDDRVALLDEPGQLAVLLDDPRAGAVDDLEAALLGALHDVRADAVGADDDGRAVVDVVERLDRLDAQVAGGRARPPRCGRPGRGYASPCRRPTLPSPCRSPRERRSRTRCASRCGLPGPFPCLDYGTGCVLTLPLRLGRRRVRRRRRHAATAAGGPRCAP